MQLLPDNSELNIAALSQSFNHMSESHKLFWFLSLMDVVKDGRRETCIDELIDKMILHAWYMVTEYKLNLGPLDSLELLINRSTCMDDNLYSLTSEKELLSSIHNSTNPEIKKLYKNLRVYVPYRLLSPFMPGIEPTCSQKSIQIINSNDTVIYHFGLSKNGYREVIIQDEWFKYLYRNQTIVTGWIEYNLIMYLQKRNPNVPGIANKIYPPQKRLLKNAGNFWKCLIEYTPIENIYRPGTIMTIKDFSIDHFVPWTFVAHDELWNLLPTTVIDNSSKNNSLAKWDVYFPRMCKVEYKAYEAIKENQIIKVLFDKCQKDNLNDNETCNRIYGRNHTMKSFCKELEDVLLPLYIAARNTRFKEWENKY